MSAWAITFTASAGDSPGRAVSHEIRLAHPARTESVPKTYALVQVKDDPGNTTGYFMDVESVICADEKCEVIPVRIHWNVLGNYERYELPSGGNFTKKDHKTFSRADHEELHRLLSDAESLLKWVEKDQVVPPEQAIQREDDEEVDGMSGATSLSLEGTVIPGAAYTCYTLWHWANGEAGAVANAITSEECSHEQLIDYLKSGYTDLAVFAIEQLAKREAWDQPTAGAVLQRAREGDESVLRPVLHYFETASREISTHVYFDAIESLFPVADTSERATLLRSLSATSLKAPPAYYDRISSWLPGLDTYFDIHQLLNLMENRNPDSAEVLKQALPLLNHDNFLIARRAFWFLENHNLTGAKREQVDAFRLKNEDRL